MNIFIRIFNKMTFIGWIFSRPLMFPGMCFTFLFGAYHHGSLAGLIVMLAFMFGYICAEEDAFGKKADADLAKKYKLDE